MNVQRLLACLMLLGAVSSTGCVVAVSDNPVLELSEAKIDPRLLGVWEDASDREPKDVFTLEKAADKPTAMLVKKSPASTTVNDPDIFLYAGSLGGMSVLNAQAISKAGAVQGNIVVRYDVSESGDEVHCRLMATTFIVEAIQRGDLAGKLSYKMPAPGEDPAAKKLNKVQITASTKELAAFVAKHGENCFQPKSEGAHYRRPKQADQE